MQQLSYIIFICFGTNMAVLSRECKNTARNNNIVEIVQHLIQLWRPWQMFASLFRAQKDVVFLLRWPRNSSGNTRD